MLLIKHRRGVNRERGVAYSGAEEEIAGAKKWPLKTFGFSAIFRRRGMFE
jgi:hypothetical protein